MEDNKRRALAKRTQKQASPVKPPQNNNITNRQTQNNSTFNKPVNNNYASSTKSTGYTNNRTNMSVGNQNNKGTVLIAPRNSDPLRVNGTNVQSHSVSSLSNQTTGNKQSVTSNSSNIFQNKNTFSNFSGSTNQNVTQRPFSGSNNSGANIIRPSGSGLTNPGQRNTGSTHSVVDKKTFYNKSQSVKGKCVLISRERFEVAIGFSAPLIELFKQMKTKLYGKFRIC